jgi:hypothetical protein
MRLNKAIELTTEYGVPDERWEFNYKTKHVMIESPRTKRRSSLKSKESLLRYLKLHYTGLDKHEEVAIPDNDKFSLDFSKMNKPEEKKDV